MYPLYAKFFDMLSNEYEKIKMRQNPSLTSRMQVGGRPMPSWVATPLAHTNASTSTPPPPPTSEPPPLTEEEEEEEESEYEEIGENRNAIAAQQQRPHGSRRGRRDGSWRRTCGLCGTPNSAVVICEMCHSQIFCGGCNDMYHRHPKRVHHIRKLIDSGDLKPPLPPKGPPLAPAQQPEGPLASLPPQPPTVSSGLPPVPPPRRNKGGRFPALNIGGFGGLMRPAASSPTLTKKTFDPVGTLKRFVGGMAGRPLPNVPSTNSSSSSSARFSGAPPPPLPPKPRDLSRPTTPVNMGMGMRESSVARSIGGFDRRQSSPGPFYPSYPQDFGGGHQSISVANLTMHQRPPSPMAFRDLPEEDFFNSRQRAQSSNVLSRYPSSSQDASHFATLQRPGKKNNNKPPPPPVPPRNYNPGLGMQSSVSAYNLNQIGMQQGQQQFPPWGNYPGYPGMMHPGYPNPTMHRTPSNQSVGGQPFFYPGGQGQGGWGPPQFGPPMSQQELDMEMEFLHHRRGSEQMQMMMHPQMQMWPGGGGYPPQQQQPPRPASVSMMSQSQPVTPQGSFRRKGRPSQFERRRENNRESSPPPPPLPQRATTPARKVVPPPPPPEPQPPEEVEEEEDLPSLSESPSGPWTCEHCTFINPKSTKICTICCKTPSSSGYKSTEPYGSRRKGSNASSQGNSTDNDNNTIPVIQSKLSISRNNGGGKDEGEATIINLVESVERVKTHKKAVEVQEDYTTEELGQAQTHHIKISTSRKPPVKKKSSLNDSNEDVYGTPPVVTLSPKIEIRPHHSNSNKLGGSGSNTTGTFTTVEQQTQVKKSTKTTSTSTGVGESTSSSSGGSTSSSSRSSGKPSSSSKINKEKVLEEKVAQSHTSSTQENNYAPGKALVNSNSKGTSPPPQNISTQTYEELPLTKKTSSNSLQSLDDLFHDPYAPPKPVEMSEKALRYERKARSRQGHHHHHHQPAAEANKLKRSLSTHLTSSSSSDPYWMDNNSNYESSNNRPSQSQAMMYRSSSRHSLLSDSRSLPLSGPPSRDTSPPPNQRNIARYFEDLRQFYPQQQAQQPPNNNSMPEDYLTSLEDLVARGGRRDSSKNQEVELSRLLKDAQDCNYSPEDIQVALRMCGEKNPVKWLQENWSSMIETVQTLATKYGREKGGNNQIGTVSSLEAKDALRSNKGNVWAAVTECIEQRRKKFIELESRGSFLREDILTALTANHGNLDAAYVELSKAQLKPFLMRIWGNEKESPISKEDTKQEEVVERKKSTSQVVVDEEEDSRLQALVSNAANVSQELEKVIQELKQQKSSTTKVTSKIFNPPPRQNGKEEKPASRLAPAAVKSDEEESFADAVTASSPSGLRSPLDNEIFGSVESGLYVDGNEEELHLLVEDEDDDILEIGFDDTEADISEFIQNFELPPPSTSISLTKVEAEPHLAEEKVEKKVVSKMETEIAAISTVENDNPVPKTDLDKADKAEPQNEPQLGSKDIEQLLTTLTSTFAEMGQFATDIKAQIASEVSQQIAAAVTNVITSSQSQSQIHTPGSMSSASTDNLYEPVSLPESVSQNVENKMAKYKRLAQKKKEIKGNGGRHKSPDARKKKDKSHSPSPAAEIVEATDSSSVYANVDDSNIVVVEEPTNIVIEAAGQSETRGEEEYNSGPDDDEEEEEEEEVDGEPFSEEEEEEEEISDDNVGESSEGGSGVGEYEDVDVDIPNPSDEAPDIELYSNKDAEEKTQKLNFKPSSSTIEKVQEDKEIVVIPTKEVVNKTEMEIRVERLIGMGAVDTSDKAHLAIQLIDMNFSEEDAVFATNECPNLCSALSFLQQECYLCAAKFSARQMVSMLRCTHVCCQTCAKEYFTVQVRDKSILDSTCPFCSEPTNLNENTESATDYFNHLDILLKSILEPKFHEMFQRKLRDWALAQTPNFKWCSKCSSGFITEPLQTRLICPDCNAVTCAICLEQWDKFGHDHKESKVKVCDAASKSIVDYLNENCVECPRCHFRYALARGGCMHLTCTQCRHEFCSGCSAPFRMGNKCEAKLPVCEKLGLHAHHPRNCLFYLRDKEPEVLSKLLEEGAIPYLRETPESGGESDGKGKVCQVPIQKETVDGLKDDLCGKEASQTFSTVCQCHYVEYLGLLIWQNQLDPISILSNDDLEVIIRRANKKHPGRPYGLSDVDLRTRLLKVIQDEIPL